MAKKTTLSVVKPIEPQLRKKTRREWEEEKDTWKITRHEAAARVSALRIELESYRDQIDAVPFDILADDIPRCLDRSKREEAVNVMEQLNPLIKGLFDRCDEIAQRHGVSEEIDYNAELFELKLQLSDTAFQVGLLAGAMFAGASRETVDRFERGLLYTMQMNPQIVK